MAKTVVSREGPYTLLHRPSGAIRVFLRLEAAAVALHALGVSRLAEPGLREWAFHLKNPRSALGYPPLAGIHWQLTNVYGEVVTCVALAPYRPAAAKRCRVEPRMRRRADPVPSTGRGGTLLFRRPSTGALVRGFGTVDADEPSVRRARRRWQLPLVWDDRFRKSERNWKSQRRTQWK